jgi:hypothetical protein
MTLAQEKAESPQNRDRNYQCYLEGKGENHAPCAPQRIFAVKLLRIVKSNIGGIRGNERFASRDNVQLQPHRSVRYKWKGLYAQVMSTGPQPVIDQFAGNFLCAYVRCFSLRSFIEARDLYIIHGGTGS